MTRYVTKRMALVINQMCVGLTGGYAANTRSNIRGGLSLGFVDRIFVNEFFGETLYPSLFHQASAYMFYIIKDHVFLDGNKRTGLLCAVTFLEWNSIDFKPFDEDKVFDFVMEVAGGPNRPETEIPWIAAWLESLSVPAPPS